MSESANSTNDQNRRCNDAEGQKLARRGVFGGCHRRVPRHSYPCIHIFVYKWMRRYDFVTNSIYDEALTLARL